MTAPVVSHVPFKVKPCYPNFPEASEEFLNQELLDPNGSFNLVSYSRALIED
jgi:hypothetical protein